MVVKLSASQLPLLLSWLQGHLPRSLKLHGEVRSHLKGRFPDSEFYVDSWPNPKAAIGMLKSSGQLFVSDHTMLQGVFGVEDQAVMTLLRDPRVLSWDKTVILASVSLGLKQALSTVAEEMEKSVSVHPVFVMTTPQDLKRVPVPEGMEFQPVPPGEGAQVIHATWKYSYQLPVSFIQGIVDHYPSAYLVTDDGNHVGHMTCLSDGAMGFLYVNPEFRRKGYGKAIVSQLSQKFFDEGDSSAYDYVEEWNTSSKTLHESLGFKTSPEPDRFWMTCS